MPSALPPVLPADPAAHLREALALRQRQVLDPAGRRPAAVLLLVYPKAGEYVVLLTKRATHLENHRGEISLPGGAFHPGEDASLLETALRETHEEVGVPPHGIQVHGQLDDQMPRSGFIISPFVASLPAAPRLAPSPHEVAEVLETPLSLLLAPDALRHEPTVYEGRAIETFYYQYQEHVIWGATARILRQFTTLFPTAAPVKASR
jgi:8-oxo-dGTP pyrophosphatase MutT (NUDIX family)